MRNLALALLLAACHPAYAETDNGQQVYTALIISYDGELTGLSGSLVFTEYGACVAYMNDLRDDPKHQPYISAKCTRFVVQGGQVALYNIEPD